MSELYCKFQSPASNTVEGIGETRTVLQIVMYRHMYGLGQNYMPLPTLRGGGSGGGHKIIYMLK